MIDVKIVRLCVVIPPILNASVCTTLRCVWANQPRCVTQEKSQPRRQKCVCFVVKGDVG